LKERFVEERMIRAINKNSCKNNTLVILYMLRCSEQNKHIRYEGELFWCVEKWRLFLEEGKVVLCE